MLAILCHTKTVQKLPGYDESDMHYMRRKDAQKQLPQTSLNGILQWFQMPSYIPLHSGVSIEIQNPKRIGLGYQCTATDKMFSHFGPIKMLKFVLKVFLFSSWCYFRSINPCKWYAICFCWAVTALYVSLFNPAKEQIRLPCPNTQKSFWNTQAYTSCFKHIYANSLSAWNQRLSSLMFYLLLTYFTYLMFGSVFSLWHPVHLS